MSSPIRDPDEVRRSARIASTQILVASVLGSMAFLAFCALRVRYPKIYVANFNHLNRSHHSLSRRHLPSLPAKSLFGWISVVFRVTEAQVLEHAGLDAVVFLSFFKMCIKLLAVCVLFSLCIISPIRYRYTGYIDGPDDHKKKQSIHVYVLWTYTLFTYVFTLVATYFLFNHTLHVITMRQNYLGKQDSIADRTVKLSGIPATLRDELELKKHFHTLGMGEIDSIVVVREWNNLNGLFKLRRRILSRLESYWVEYLRANGYSTSDVNNFRPSVGALYNMENGVESYRDVPDTQSSINSPTSDSRSVSPQSVHGSVIDRIVEASGLSPFDDLDHRPKTRTGFLGIFGPKTDAIDHYTQQLLVIDKEISRARTREYPGSSTAFITMKSVAQAQMVAQAVLDPKVNHLITNLAPAPHDIIWDNLCLTRKERNARIFFVTLSITLLSIVLVKPVTDLTKILSISYISNAWPSLGAFLDAHRWAETLITGLSPTYLFTIMNMVIPYFYIWITSKQGYTSHSDEELSVISKNFFYIFVNLFLVFTMAGTASLSDGKIANHLAQSVQKLSLFYVDLIILQGLGIFPYKLLLMGNLLRFSFRSLFWCKTPRDLLKLYQPPVFNFGLQLPQPILILIVTIVYSVMSTKILSAGLLYFLIGYFVYKYQLLYACVHPPHSTGKVWPLIFRRFILGLLIFQLTMVGTFALQKAYYCATCLAPLPLVTMACLWNYQQNYISLSLFIALRSIENGHTETEDAETVVGTTKYATVDEQREFNTTYEYPRLIDNLDGPLIAVDRNEMLLINSDGILERKPQIHVSEWD